MRFCEGPKRTLMASFWSVYGSSICPIINLFLPSFMPHCFELEQHAHVSEVDVPLQLHLESPEIQELGYEYTIM